MFDIRPLFGLTPQDPTGESRIVVCGDAEPDLGLLADAASEVVRLPAHEIRSDAVTTEAAAKRLIRGIARDALIVLDGAALLADQRLIVDQTFRQ